MSNPVPSAQLNDVDGEMAVEVSGHTFVVLFFLGFVQG